MEKTLTEYELLGIGRAWIPLACLAVLALACIVHAAVWRKNHGKIISWGTVAWTLPFIGLLAFFAAWCRRGLLDVPGPWIAGSSVFLVAAGFVVLARDYTIDRMSGTASQRSIRRHQRTRKAGVRGIRNIAILAVAAVASYFALYLPWIDTFAQMKLMCILLELGMIALLLLGLYFLSQHTGIGPAIGVAAFALLGLADYFVYQFRGTDLKPSDLLSLGTAAAVAGNYDYSLDVHALMGILCAAFGIMALSHVSPGKGAISEKGPLRIVCSALVGCLLLGSLAGLCTMVDFDKDLDISFHDWIPRENYRVDGFLPAFVSGAQSLQISKPEGYSREKADAVLAQYVTAYDAADAASSGAAGRDSASAAKAPSVIVVMNETFTDLGALYDGLHVGYDGPQFFNNGLDDAIIRGNLGVPVLGGRTCNTEFEFLTGISNQFVSPSAEPFTLFDFNDAPSLARQFKEQGYASYAIHPNLASNWRRDKAFAELGFDGFYSIDDFDSNAAVFHNGVADFETYDMILDILAEHSEPVFVFDVTMQNHSGYANNDIPEDLLTGYEPSGKSDYWDAEITDVLNAQLNEYLSCIEASDRDLEYLIGRLRETDEPVLVVFFGDHQPSIASTYNYAWAADTDTRLSREYMLYQTQYFVWANYDLGQEETAVQDTSADALAALALEKAGLPLTDLQKARLAIGGTLQMVTGAGFSTADGVLYENAIGQVQQYDDLALLDYRFFGDAD